MNQLKLMFGHLLLLLPSDYIPQIQELLYSLSYLETLDTTQSNLKQVVAIRRINYQLFSLSLGYLNAERHKLTLRQHPTTHDMARLNLAVKQLALITEQVRLLQPH